MSKLSDVHTAGLLGLLGNVNLTRGILAINAISAATVKSTNAFVYTIGGVYYGKAVLATQSIVTTHDSYGNVAGGYVQPLGVTAYLTLGLNAAGVLCSVQGTFAGQTANSSPTVGVGPVYNSGTSFLGSGAVPDVPAGFTAIGVLKVVTTTATFTPGTTLLDAAGVLVTYFDVALLPVGAL